MRPALSVIFFTVSSGAGLGIIVWLVLFDGIFGTAGIPHNAIYLLLALGLTLTAAGLISSTLHLANPKNAWRAFSQIRTSWLSREGVFAVSLFPIAFLYALLHWSSAPNAMIVATGVLLGAIALAVLYCTGMIYACLKTIPRWHSGLVPIGYVMLGLYSGLLLALPVFAAFGDVAIGHKAAIVVVALMLALIVKAIYYLRFRTPIVSHTINDALALGKKSIRLLDVGHTHGTFLTDEFCFVLARGHAQLLRTAAIVLGFVAPFILLLVATNNVVGLAFAGALCLFGLLAERWLFFAEAEHVVRLYHGASVVR